MKLELVKVISDLEELNIIGYNWCLEANYIYLESIRYDTEEKATIALISNNIEWEVVDLDYDKFVGCG
ncbi:MAG: hypothetical protein GY853_16130 [PVC group bacterium]|nr:hypothetical protein [PVC group bacterium]